MYLFWNKKIITDFSDPATNAAYAAGYLFGRTGKGEMYQTRSLRIDLAKFELSSENRRVLRKTENLTLQKHPLPYSAYHWGIGKMGKKFYDTKFGVGTFSANKIKELMTEPEKSNFNSLLRFVIASPALGGAKQSPGLPYQPGSDHQGIATPPSGARDDSRVIGYAVCLETNQLLHYAYPFYWLPPLPKGGGRGGVGASYLPPNTGLGMMLRAILWARDAGKKYIYLGSFQRPADTYKLQFAGLEWWSGTEWQTDQEQLKKILKHGT